jgi:hypothetical protein
MAGSGSSPGERRGGRKAGTPNKGFLEACSWYVPKQAIPMSCGLSTACGERYRSKNTNQPLSPERGFPLRPESTGILRIQVSFCGRSWLGGRVPGLCHRAIGEWRLPPQPRELAIRCLTVSRLSPHSRKVAEDRKEVEGAAACPASSILVRSWNSPL